MRRERRTAEHSPSHVAANVGGVGGQRPLTHVWVGRTTAYLVDILRCKPRCFEKEKRKTYLTLTGSGVSVELGHKFDLSRLFLVEPSLQLSYGHYRAHNTVLSNGMTLTQTSFNSLTGRAGFTAGAKVWREGDLLGEVWLNAGVMREFKGESTLHVNGVAFEETLLGTRYYYGMGADLAFTPNVKLYAVAEHQQGKLMQDSLGLKAGIKWQF